MCYLPRQTRSDITRRVYRDMAYRDARAYTWRCLKIATVSLALGALLLWAWVSLGESL